MGVARRGRRWPYSAQRHPVTEPQRPLLRPCYPPGCTTYWWDETAGRRDPTRPGLWVREHLARTGARMPVDRLGGGT
jgi:hypothetical protein